MSFIAGMSGISGRQNYGVAAFSASVALTTGKVTFGQVIPFGQLPSGKVLQVGALTTQTDIKTTWSDGSARFAIVSCDVPSDGDYTLASADSQDAAITDPAIPSNTYVDLDIGGAGTTVYRATCPTSHSADTWLDGPICVESRHEVIPLLTSDGTTEHGWLRVIFDVRSYSATVYRIDVTVENVLDKSTADSVTYDVEIFVNNVSQFSKASVTHGYLARWRKYFDTSGIGYGDPNVTKMEEAYAIPIFFRSGRNPTYSTAGVAFEILKAGDLNSEFPAPGGRPEIAYYPTFAAEYLVNQSTSQREYVLAHGDLAGSWPVHIRNEGDNVNYTGLGDMNFVNIDEETLYWLNGSANAGEKPAGNLGALPTGFTPDVAHQPSLAYIPYLITGDRYYNDEMAYWAVYCLINTYPYGSSSTSRGATGAEGLLYLAQQPRGIAWGIRNMTDASLFCVDSAVKSHLAEKVTNNLQGVDDLATSAIADSANPLNQMFTTTFSGIRPQGSFSSWMNNYICWALDHAIKSGYSDGSTCRDQLAQNLIDRWNLDESTWPNSYIAASYVDVYEWDGSTQGPYHDTWLDVFVQTYGDTPGGSPGAASPFNGSYGVDHAATALIAIEQGLTNAQALRDYIITEIKDSYNSADQFSADFYFKLGWSIMSSQSEYTA